MISTKIMGILNVTPDSCYDGGSYHAFDKAIAHAQKLYQDGADILDIGGESTRPGAEPVPLAEELERVIPVIKAVRPLIPIPISVDTLKPEVAAQAVAAGANIINDVTGFADPAMREVAISTEADIVVMHMQGEPRTMQINPHYPEGMVNHLLNWFEQRVDELVQFGIKEENIIIDPGIGFGKTVAHNIEIIQNLPEFRALGFRVLVGVSRKDFMRKITGKDRDQLLPTTIAVNTLLMMENIDIIRVHDVAEHRMVRQVLEPLTACSGCSCC